MNFDIDHIFVTLHVRTVHFLCKYLSRPIRYLLLLLAFLSALIVLLLLIWLHVQHVHISPKHQSFLSPAPAICAPELTSILGTNPYNRVVEIIIQGPKWIEQIQMEKEKEQEAASDGQEIPAELRNQRLEFELDEHGDATRLDQKTSQEPMENHTAKPTGSPFHSDSFVYQYSRERGYFLLSSRALVHHELEILQFHMPYNHPCFGPPLLARFTYHILGYDTIILNQLINIFGYKGFVRNKKTFDLYPLTPYNEENEPSVLSSLSLSSFTSGPLGKQNTTAFTSYDPAVTKSPYVFSPTHSPNHWIELRYSVLEWAEFFLYKFGLFITVLFLFFSISTLVSLTLTQTQIRMLIFTEALRSSLRLHAPILGLVLEHLVQSLAFVPVVIGMLFFLFEFFGDQILSFLLLILVWICESFTVIFVRTSISMRFFPKLFAAFFMSFGLYFFNFPYGFHYVAILSTYLILQCFMAFYLFHYEIPAVLNGEISVQRPRMLVLKRRGRTVQMRNMSQVEVNPEQLNGFSHPAVNIEQDRLRMHQQTERLMRLMMSMNMQVQQHYQIQQQMAANQSQPATDNRRDSANAGSDASEGDSASASGRSSNATSPSLGPTSPTRPVPPFSGLGDSAVSAPAFSGPLFPTNAEGTAQVLAALRQLPEMLSSMIRNAQALRTMSVQQQQQLRAQMAQFAHAQNQAQAQNAAPQDDAAPSSASEPAAQTSAPPQSNSQRAQAQLNHLRTHIFEQLAHALQVSLYVLNTLVYGSGTIGGSQDPHAPALPLLHSIRSLQNQLAQAQILYNQSLNSGHNRRGSRTVSLNAFPVGFASSSGSGHTSGSSSNAGSPMLGPLAGPRNLSTPSGRRPHSSSSTPLETPASFDDYVSMGNDPMPEFDLNSAEPPPAADEVKSSQ